MRQRIAVIGAAVVILNGADIVITRVGIANGVVHEANPLMAPLVRMGGGIDIALKLFVPVVLVAAARSAASPRSVRALAGVAGLYASVVASNALLIAGRSGQLLLPAAAAITLFLLVADLCRRQELPA